jgi:hypothetical protein
MERTFCPAAARVVQAGHRSRLQCSPDILSGSTANRNFEPEVRVWEWDKPTLCGYVRSDNGVQRNSPLSKPHKKKQPPKRVLVLPGLEWCKAAVLNNLTPKSDLRTNDRAITDFVGSDCSEASVRVPTQRVQVGRSRFGSASLWLPSIG